MFGRELKIKFLELRCVGNLLDEGVRDCDWNYKFIYKEYVDNKWGVVESFVVFGDLVLLKNMKMFGKLEVNFESELYIV